MDLYTLRNLLAVGKSIFELEMSVTYYARVSTDKDEQLHSLSAQINYYEEVIKKNTCWTFIPGYVDEGLSGKSIKKRDAFQRMMDDAKLKKFNLIITKEISRFARNTVDSIMSTQELLKSGVGVFFQSDNIITLLPDSELRLTIMASIAQDELRKLSERVKFGFKRSIESGTVLGSNKIWGYTKDKGKLVINEEEAKVVRLIFEIYTTQGVGIRRVAQQLNSLGYRNKSGNPFSFSTISGILTNPKYKGYYCGNKTHKYDYMLDDIKRLDESEWVMYKDEENVPPIVSEEMWEKANFIYTKRSAKVAAQDRTSYSNKYAYSCKLVCMEHNVSYYRAEYRYKSGNKEIWQCKRYAEKGRAEGGCQGPIIYTTELDEVMRFAYSQIIKERAPIINEMAQMYMSISNGSRVQDEIARVNEEVKKLLKQKDKLLELSIEGRISNEEFEKRNNGCNDFYDKLIQKLAELKEEELKAQDMAYSLDTLRAMLTEEFDFEKGFTNQTVDSILDRIEVYGFNEAGEIELKVFIKVFEEALSCKLLRARGKTSVCYTPCI